MQDLFLKDKSKKEQLHDWIKSKGRVRTSEVMQWGLDNYHIRADRDCRNFAEENKIWRMREDIKIALYKNTKEDVWSTYEADR